MVADELASMIDDDEPARSKGMLLPTAARRRKPTTVPSQQDLLRNHHTDWERRLKAIQKIEVNAETFPAVVTALDDERSAVQRWAAIPPAARPKF